MHGTVRLFIYMVSPSLGSTPSGRPNLRAAEGVNFPLKNKVEGLSPSTLRMDLEVWLHLRTTLGFAPPSPRLAGRYPSEFLTFASDLKLVRLLNRWLHLINVTSLGKVYILAI